MRQSISNFNIPPQANPRPFKLFNIGLFQFPSPRGKEPLQMPHQLLQNYNPERNNMKLIPPTPRPKKPMLNSPEDKNPPFCILNSFGRGGGGRRGEVVLSISFKKSEIAIPHGITCNRNPPYPPPKKTNLELPRTEKRAIYLISHPSFQRDGWSKSSTLCLTLCLSSKTNFLFDQTLHTPFFRQVEKFNSEMQAYFSQFSFASPKSLGKVV